MARKEPFLDPPGAGWKRDLPGPNDRPERDVYLSSLSNPPNHMDNVYLELPCSTLRARGVFVWLGFGGSVMIVVMLAILIFMPVPFVLYIFCSFIIYGMSIMTISSFKIDINIPKDEPVRFNRMRGRVYVYRYHSDIGRPFNSARWGLRPAVYDWEDLRVEACGTYGPMGTGGSVQTISIAAVRKGTNQVVDRFILSHNHQQGEILWAMAQTFMQQGPQALPEMTRPPRDWNNEDPGWNLARRFAPKVQWPHEMDIESRTAP